MLFTQTHADRVVFALNNVFKQDIASETIKALSDTLIHLDDLEKKVKELENKKEAQSDDKVD